MATDPTQTPPADTPRTTERTAQFNDWECDNGVVIRLMTPEELAPLPESEVFWSINGKTTDLADIRKRGDHEETRGGLTAYGRKIADAPKAALRASEVGRMDDQSRSDQPQLRAGESDLRGDLRGVIAEMERLQRELDTDYARALQGEVKGVLGNWRVVVNNALVVLKSGSGTDSASAEHAVDRAGAGSAIQNDQLAVPSVEGTETANQTIKFLQQEAALKSELATRPFSAVSDGRYRENLEVALTTLVTIARRDGGHADSLIRALLVAEYVLTHGYPSAVSGDQRQAGWQPIASAPRNMTSVLVFDADWCGTGPKWTVSHWQPERPTQPPIEQSFPGVSNATHWMPLPAPPSGSSAEQEKTS